MVEFQNNGCAKEKCGNLRSSSIQNRPNLVKDQSKGFSARRMSLLMLLKKSSHPNRLRKRSSEERFLNRFGWLDFL